MKVMNSFCYIFLLCATQRAASVSIDKTQGHLSQGDPKDDKKPVVVRVEEEARRAPNRLMNALDEYRAKVCADMKDEHGKEFATFEECHEFMERTCNPQADMLMDGDKGEVSSHKGYCKEYFPAAKKEKKKPEKEPTHIVTGPASPSPGPSPGPASPAAAQESPAPATQAAAPAAVGPAPSPGPMSAPAAPIPSPFIPGVSGGKPWGPIGEDEAYYYKKGGKDPSRMHMSEKLKLPEHGYWGKLVEHEDMKTSSNDWMREFGPNSGHQSIAEICRHHPESMWCRRREAFRHLRSSSPIASSAVASLFITLFMMTAM